MLLEPIDPNRILAKEVNRHRMLPQTRKTRRQVTSLGEMMSAFRTSDHDVEFWKAQSRQENRLNEDEERKELFCLVCCCCLHVGTIRHPFRNVTAEQYQSKGPGVGADKPLRRAKSASSIEAPGGAEMAGREEAPRGEKALEE